MLCQMVLTSHLLVQAVIESCGVNEIVLAKQLIAHTGPLAHPVRQGVLRPRLLHAWQTTGSEQHLVAATQKGLPISGGTQAGGQDALVHLKTSPQARRKCPQLADMVAACLLTRHINGKERQVLTSMVDPMSFPGADIVELYSQRREIELGCREMKHSLQQHRLTLPGKKAAGIRQ